MNTRHSKILHILREKKYASVAFLSENLYISESTIRRDLNELQRDGLIVRTRGGAMFVEDTYLEWPLAFKSFANTDKKQIIALKALALLKDNQTIFMDSSSTCTTLAKCISEKKGLTFLTSGIVCASILSDIPTAKVYTVCGEVYPKRYSITGTDACEYISHFYGDISFVSCRGISNNAGITDFSKGDSEVKKAFRQRSKKVALLADSTKLGKEFFHKTFDLPQIDYFISDGELPAEIFDALTKYGCKIL